MRLNLLDDATHGFHRQARIRTGRGFRGQHDGVRAIKDGVRDVTGLGTCRSRMLNHRLEHLGGRNDRSTHAIGERDNVLLRDRYLFEGQLDAKITARHHHRIGGTKNFFDVVQGDILFDLGDDQHRFRNQRAQLVDVLGPTDETEGQCIEVVFHREREISAILLRQRRRRHGDAGQVHALVAAQQSAVHHNRGHAQATHGGHQEFDQTVVDENAIARPDVVREVVIGDRDLVGFRDVFGCKNDRAAVLKLTRRVQRPDANTRALQVAENGHGPTEFGGDRTHDVDRSGVLFVRTVRKIDARDVQPRLDQIAYALGRIARWAECADNLGARHVGALKWRRRIVGDHM